MAKFKCPNGVIVEVETCKTCQHFISDNGGGDCFHPFMMRHYKHIRDASVTSQFCPLPGKSGYAQGQPPC